MLPQQRKALIGAGARFRDVFAALAPHSVAAVTGSCPHVGIAGFSLGGGWGALSAGRGLGVDNVLSYRVALADGRVVEAARDGPHADLFWALLGGGHGSFGVVTGLTYRVFPLTEVATFNATWDIAGDAGHARAAEVLLAWQAKLLNKEPRGLSTWPHIYADARTGRRLLAIYAAYAPDGVLAAAAEQEMRKAVQPLIALAPTSQAFERRAWPDMPNLVVRNPAAVAQGRRGRQGAAAARDCPPGMGSRL